MRNADTMNNMSPNVVYRFWQIYYIVYSQIFKFIYRTNLLYIFSCTPVNLYLRILSIKDLFSMHTSNEIAVCKFSISQKRKRFCLTSFVNLICCIRCVGNIQSIYSYIQSSMCMYTTSQLQVQHIYRGAYSLRLAFFYKFGCFFLLT